MKSPLLQAARSGHGTPLAGVKDTLGGGSAGSRIPDWRAWRVYAPILLAALAGLLVTWLLYSSIADLEKEKRLSEFTEAARDRQLVIQREVVSSLGVVLDVGSFFDASDSVSRRQFREFVGPSLKRNKGIVALMWVPRVPEEERSAFIAEARRSFAPFEITERQLDGGIRTSSPRTVHFPVLYIQPYQANREMLGLDLGADANTLSALQDASTTDALHVSDPQPLAAEAVVQPGFSVYLPVRHREAEREWVDAEPPEASPAEETPGALLGFAIGIFRFKDLVDRALGSLGASGVDIQFFSSAPEPGQPPFYVHHSRARVRPPGRPEPVQGAARPTYQGEIQVGNRSWTVVCTPVPGFFEPAAWSGWLVLGGGMAFTLLVSVYLYTIIGQAQKIKRLVAQRTFQLEQANSALNIEVAERRRAENALQMLNVTLEHWVAKRTAEAEHRARDLEQFAYVAAHDLKAPLRAIANLARWLKEDLRDRLTPETGEQLDLLRDRVARMNALVEGLLAYSRIGRTPASVEKVDSGQLLADTIDSVAPPAGFTVKVAPGMPTLYTDRIQLGQVFANLISNAINHHDRDHGQIRVSGNDLGERCAFEVADDGPGIAPEYHDKVFKMFQTLRVKDFGGDTGIGLALVKKLVEEHGGEISLDSGPGRGCRFSFTWSKQDAPTAYLPEPATSNG